MSALKLAEIEVDVNSAQLMMKEEINMLKAALENGENVPADSKISTAGRLKFKVSFPIVIYKLYFLNVFNAVTLLSMIRRSEPLSRKIAS